MLYIKMPLKRKYTVKRSLLNNVMLLTGYSQFIMYLPPVLSKKYPPFIIENSDLFQRKIAVQKTPTWDVDVRVSN